MNYIKFHDNTNIFSKSFVQNLRVLKRLNYKDLMAKAIRNFFESKIKEERRVTYIKFNVLNGEIHIETFDYFEAIELGPMLHYCNVFEIEIFHFSLELYDRVLKVTEEVIQRQINNFINFPNDHYIKKMKTYNDIAKEMARLYYHSDVTNTYEEALNIIRFKIGRVVDVKKTYEEIKIFSKIEKTTKYYITAKNWIDKFSYKVKIEKDEDKDTYELSIDTYEIISQVKGLIKKINKKVEKHINKATINKRYGKRGRLRCAI